MLIHEKKFLIQRNDIALYLLNLNGNAKKLSNLPQIIKI